MADYVLTDQTRDRLKRTSTASIATQLFKRGLRNQFVQDVAPVTPKDENQKKYDA